MTGVILLKKVITRKDSEPYLFNDYFKTMLCFLLEFVVGQTHINAHKYFSWIKNS